MAAAIVAGTLLASCHILPKENTYLRSATLGGTYLLEHLNDDGRYIYEYNPVTDEVFRRYNILRHAGTTYSLLELYEVTKDKQTLRAAERALDYLVNAIEPCPGNPAAGCLVERGIVKLGGNGLAVLAMAKHAEVTGSQKYIPRARYLAEFITDVQSDEGEFTIHKMDVADGNVYDFISMYYPGEAIFALAKLHQIDANDRWIASAHSGAHWLIGVRDAGKSIRNLEHDHWLLYALNELHEHRSDAIYVEHSKKITDAILRIQHQGLTGERESWNGGYYNPPRSTPTATRGEGLFAAYQTLQRSGEYAEHTETILHAIKRGLEFQLRTQMTPEKIQALNANPKSLGGFHASLDDYSIRIDYVQHNISALLGYVKIAQK